MLDRRSLLKLSLASIGTETLRNARPLSAWFGDPPPSPRVTPFVHALPIPPLASYRPAFETAAHFPPQSVLARRYFEVISEERAVRLHPQLPLTRIWGYRDAGSPTSSLMLGPTLVGRSNEPFVLRYTNRLPTTHQGFGLTHTVLHLHGYHGDARYDGFPENVHGYTSVIAPGESYDHAVTNLDPGALDGQPDASDRPATMWYHDHVLDYTAQNVMRGLAGAFVFFDELDTGNETTELRLPSGAYDIPLVLQDRRLDAAGQLWYDPLDHNGFLGDLFLVNGAIQPFLNVSARKYRFRLLNGCNARFLAMHLTRENGTVEPLAVIATEGGLMSTTLRNERMLFTSPAQRLDFVVDFSRYAPGTVLYLENRLDQPDGRGPRGAFDNPGLLPRGDRFLKIVVGDPVEDPSQLPDVLRPFSPISASVLATAERRDLRFSRSNGVWVVNNQAVDLERPLFTIQRGRPQIWTFRNNSGGWWHPIHPHLEHMRVLRRNGGQPSRFERDGQARLDTVNLGANDEVQVYYKAHDYTGRWVIHCHTIEHEDAFMMACFDVV